MKQFIIIASIAIALFSSFVIGKTRLLSNEVLYLKDVESLTDIEIPIDICDNNCRFVTGYYCILYTNHDFPIYCPDAVPWFI